MDDCLEIAAGQRHLAGLRDLRVDGDDDAELEVRGLDLDLMIRGSEVDAGEDGHLRLAREGFANDGDGAGEFVFLTGEFHFASLLVFNKARYL